MILEQELGMSEAEANDTGWRGTGQGHQMRSTNGWNDDDNSTNSSGFSGLPGGRHSGGSIYEMAGNMAFWWTSTLSGNLAKGRALGSGVGGVLRNNYSFGTGFSVRCLEDTE